VRLLWGSCDALFTPRPLAPFQEIAWQLGGEPAERFAAGAPRDMLFQSIYQALRPPNPPSLLVVEDVHWADEATLDLLKFLGRRAQRTRALLAITYRDDEVGDRDPLRLLLGDLARVAAARALCPAPLSAQAVRSLAERAGRSVEGLHAVTGGNPFFVTEALASEGSRVPGTVRDAVLARAARLSPEARELVDIASVVPSRVELSLLSDAAGPAASALEEALGSGMLELADESIAFRHELARHAVEDALAPLRSRKLHARILELLEGRGEASLARLAHHADRAGDARAVLRLAPGAAEQAARMGAHREAMAHYAAALHHSGDVDPEHRAALLEAHSYESYMVGLGTEAMASRQASLEIWQRLGRAEKVGSGLRWMSRLHWMLGRSDESHAYAARAVDTLEPLPPGRDLAMAYSNRAQLHMLRGETAEAIAWGEKALTLARKLGDPETEAHALNNIGTAQIQVGNPEGNARLEESLRLSLAHDLEEHAARAYTNLGTGAVELRRHEEAARWIEAGLEYASEGDLDSWRYYLLAWRARLRLVQGRWSEAAEDALRVADHVSASPIGRMPALAALGLLRVRRGDPNALAPLDEARDLALRMAEGQRVVPVAVARAEAAWLAGDLGRTLAEAEAALPFASEARTGSRAGRSAWHLGEVGLWIWRGGGRAPEPGEMAEPFALQIGGDWRGAAEAFRRLGCPYEAALACFEGDDAAALEEALRALEGLGARPAAARMRARLADLGTRDLPPAAPPGGPGRAGEGGRVPGEQGPKLDLSLLLRELASPEESPAGARTSGLVPGQAVGRFEILQEIGRGGFGAVYAALDVELGRSVALKTLRPARARDQASADWLRKEAEAIARLDHPAIVTLFEVGTGEDGPYLVEELLRGETLAQRLGRGPLPPAEGLDVAIEIARALAHAHGHGVLHRDLKPGNVFLTEDGRVKLLDFGLAHFLGRRGAAEGGTPAYMAPEQARGEAADERADVFAAGAVLFEALAGRRPFEVREGRTDALGDGPAPQVPSGVPRPLARALARALSRPPADRQRNGQAWLEALLAARRALERPREARRLALRLALGVALGVALAAAVAWLLGPSLRRPPPLAAPPETRDHR
jgi:tetratricopeptide (TPR) repeat protein